MEERKEWRTLYMINKPVYFMGFRPVQWLYISCILFLIGYAVWWLLLFLVPVVYSIGRKLAKEHTNGNPGYISSLIVRRSMPKYFEDQVGIFDQLIIHEMSPESLRDEFHVTTEDQFITHEAY